MILPSYLIKVLAATEAWHDDAVWFDVEQVGKHLYLIEAPDRMSVLVDTKLRLVEDSIDALVPPGLPGRFEPEHSFRVRFTRDDGSPEDVTIEASSAKLARLAVKAPPDAVAEEVGL